MNSEEVLLLNAMVYTITLLYFYLKYKMSVGVLIWVLYTVSAWSSFFFVQQPMYAGTVHDSEQTIMPCIYLYLVFILAMQPLMKFNTIEEIDLSEKERFLKCLMLICTGVQIIFVIVDIPAIIQVLGSNSINLSSLRSTVYGDEGLSYVTKNVLLNKISLLYSGMRIPATGLSIIAFVTSKDDRKLVTAFAVSALLNNIRIIIVQVGRGEMVLVFLLYICTLYLIREWLNKKMLRKIVIYALPIVVVGAIFFWAITFSRFGDSAGYFMWKYLGEPINNFNGILFKKIRGTTNGRAYFSLFYRYILGESGVTNADDKWALIKQATGIRGDIFYTWVGGLIIEFGKAAPVIVALVFNRILSSMASTRRYFTGDLIILVFFMNFFLRGIFLFPTQNFEGTLMIIYTIIFYFIFRIRKNGAGHLVYVLPRSKNKHREM